jgi:hypothetical protein
MAYINQPIDLRLAFDAIKDRLRKLETAVRFTAPNVDFATNTPTNPRIGDIFYDTDAQLLTYWNGTAWVEIADNLYSTTITTVTNSTLKSANNNLTYTGSPVLIELQRVGKMVTAYAQITGTTVTNWGTGQIYFQFPAGFPTFAHEVVASGTIKDGGTLYTIFGVIPLGDNRMYLYSPTSNGGSDIVDHNSPAVLDSTSVITINGVALIA